MGKFWENLDIVQPQFLSQKNKTNTKTPQNLSGDKEESVKR